MVTVLDFFTFYVGLFIISIDLPVLLNPISVARWKLLSEVFSTSRHFNLFLCQLFALLVIYRLCWTFCKILLSPVKCGSHQRHHMTPTLGEIKKQVGSWNYIYINFCLLFTWNKNIFTDMTNIGFFHSLTKRNPFFFWIILFMKDHVFYLLDSAGLC